MTQYGMVIDLSRCVRCGSCMISCKAEHSLPQGIYWTRVLRKESGKYPLVEESVMPILCNHCQDAACVKVCPSGATTKQDNGLVVVEADKCIGCRYCMMACPYGARFYHNELLPYYPDRGFTLQEELSQSDLQRGVVIKCTFCRERIQAGTEKGLRPGVDREATPTCVNNCIGKARYFGDLDDPNTEVSQLARSPRAFRLLEELGTKPKVIYLAEGERSATTTG